MDKIIYIADDDNNIRNLLKSFLEREGFNCFGFETGDDLLKKFIQDPCDLIILDVMMPGRDGFFICSELRKISNVPIIMLTARDSDSDYIEGLNMGSERVLSMYNCTCLSATLLAFSQFIWISHSLVLPIVTLLPPPVAFIHLWIGMR